MSEPARATYSPVADPRDLVSIPRGLGANDELLVPLAPRRGPPRPPSWLRRLRDAHRLVASFCISDRQLLRWEARPGAAEQAVAALAPSSALTLDVPFYGFMSPAQRERALARSLAAITRGCGRWERAGVRPIPLIKGLGATDWEPQLGLARDLGLSRAASYVREQRLEGDETQIAAFAKAARRHGLRPLLVGCFRPAARLGPLDAAALHHYVLACRGRMLDRAGRARAVPPGAYSDLVGRFFHARDRALLTQHNFLRARAFFEPSPPLSRFGLEAT